MKRPCSTSLLLSSFWIDSPRLSALNVFQRVPGPSSKFPLQQRWLAGHFTAADVDHISDNVHSFKRMLRRQLSTHGPSIGRRHLNEAHSPTTTAAKRSLHRSFSGVDVFTQPRMAETELINWDRYILFSFSSSVDVIVPFHLPNFFPNECLDEELFMKNNQQSCLASV